MWLLSLVKSVLHVSLSVLNPKVVVWLVLEVVLVKEHDVEDVQERQADGQHHHLVSQGEAKVHWIISCFLGVAEHPGHERSHDDKVNQELLSEIVHC